MTSDSVALHLHPARSVSSASLALSTGASIQVTGAKVASGSASVTGAGTATAVGRKVESPPTQAFPIDREAIQDAIITIAAVGYIAEHPRSTGVVVGLLFWLLVRHPNR